jgi:predicted Zn-dependent peptidase
LDNNIWSSPLRFCEHRLENGLEIIAECNPNAYSTGLAFFVRTGSRDETDELSGVSHFLEHMAFKGTARRSAADVNREFDELGAQSNAFTSEEQTVFYASVLPEYQDQAVALLCDIMRPALREDDFQTEKQVILEEIAKYDDQPPFGAHEKSMAAHFGDHPLARSVLGTLQSVGQLTSEQMRTYFERRYCPNNLTLVAAGNLQFEQLVETARRYCDDWQPRIIQRETPRAAACTVSQFFHHEAATLEYVIQIANGPAAEDSNRFAARLLSLIVGDDSGSRMFWEFIDTGRAECAVMFANEFQGTGIYMTMLSGLPNQLSENLSRQRNILRDVQDQGISRAELELAQNKTCSMVVLQSERPINRLFALGDNWLQRREYRTVREVLRSYQSVTSDEIAAVIHRYPLTVHSTVAVGPLEPPGTD